MRSLSWTVWDLHSERQDFASFPSFERKTTRDDVDPEADVRLGIQPSLAKKVRWIGGLCGSAGRTAEDAPPDRIDPGVAAPPTQGSTLAPDFARDVPGGGDDLARICVPFRSCIVSGLRLCAIKLRYGDPHDPSCRNERGRRGTWRRDLREGNFRREIGETGEGCVPSPAYCSYRLDRAFV